VFLHVQLTTKAIKSRRPRGERVMQSCCLGKVKNSHKALELEIQSNTQFRN